LSSASASTPLVQRPLDPERSAPRRQGFEFALIMG
jgi:hypothetical protein